MLVTDRSRRLQGVQSHSHIRVHQPLLRVLRLPHSQIHVHQTTTDAEASVEDLS